MIDGIYAGYFTGALGNSFGLFLFKEGVIAGADAGGAVYDGQYEYSVDGAHVEGHVVLRAAENTQLIAGPTTGSGPLELTIPIKFPAKMNEADVYRIETSVGPVNAKFRKIRSLP